MVAGTALAKRLSAAVLRRGFAWCVVLLGVALVVWNGMALFAGLTVVKAICGLPVILGGVWLIYAAP